MNIKRYLLLKKYIDGELTNKKDIEDTYQTLEYEMEIDFENIYDKKTNERYIQSYYVKSNILNLLTLNNVHYMFKISPQKIELSSIKLEGKEYITEITENLPMLREIPMKILPNYSKLLEMVLIIDDYLNLILNRDTLCKVEMNYKLVSIKALYFEDKSKYYVQNEDLKYIHLINHIWNLILEQLKYTDVHNVLPKYIKLFCSTFNEDSFYNLETENIASILLESYRNSLNLTKSEHFYFLLNVNNFNISHYEVINKEHYFEYIKDRPDSKTLITVVPTDSGYRLKVTMNSNFKLLLKNTGLLETTFYMSEVKDIHIFLNNLSNLIDNVFDNNNYVKLYREYQSYLEVENLGENIPKIHVKESFIQTSYNDYQLEIIVNNKKYSPKPIKILVDLTHKFLLISSDNNIFETTYKHSMPFIFKDIPLVVTMLDTNTKETHKLLSKLDSGYSKVYEDESKIYSKLSNDIISKLSETLNTFTLIFGNLFIKTRLDLNKVSYSVQIIEGDIVLVEESELDTTQLISILNSI